MVSKRRYITAQRLAEIEASMTERDRAVLSDVARISVASGKQLQRLHYESSEAGRRLARADLARLATWDVLVRLGRTVGGERAGSAGWIYSLGVVGQRLAYPSRQRFRQPWTPQPNHLQHALAVTELYLGLTLTDSTSVWKLTRFDAEPACWRWFSSTGGAKAALKPDAFVIIEDGAYEDRLFVEMDCATESMPRIAEKAKTYIRYWQSGREQAAAGVFPKVLWIAPDARRAEQITDELTRLPAEHWRIFAVVTAAQAAGRIAAGDFGEHTWIANRKEVIG